ncbi:MAG: V-type ATP synthase subunit K [Pleurocapsa sp. SU_196_0]|nr:V-type ATP synthase subunit K [Pleurocapsa sp. SU_196_0]
MKKVLAMLVPALALIIFGSLGLAQEAETVVATGTSLGGGLVALGAGLALGLAAIGVGIAQSQIGSAAAGAVAEKPELFGQLLIYVVIPETVIIFGFLVVIFFQPFIK